MAAATVRGLILTVSHREQIGELYPQVLETLVYGACRELCLNKPKGRRDAAFPRRTRVSAILTARMHALGEVNLTLKGMIAMQEHKNFWDRNARRYDRFHAQRTARRTTRCMR